MVKKSLGDFDTSTALLDTSSEKTALKINEQGQAQVDLNILREKCSVFFATPCYGGLVTDQFFLSIFKASQELVRHGITFRLTTLRNESLVTRARNILSAMFLESGATHLFFIDADIEFEPDSVIRMLAMDKDIIAGAYPKKALPVQYAMNFKYTDPVKKQIRVENGAVEVWDASTGFFCIKREVFEKMMLAYPDLHYKNDSNIDPKLQKFCYAFFDTMIDKDENGDNRYLSEDYTFCRLWQRLGGEIWMDPNTRLNHVGSYTFEGDLSKIISMGR
jgi:hypothetical protein